MPETLWNKWTRAAVPTTCEHYTIIEIEDTLKITGRYLVNLIINVFKSTTLPTPTPSCMSMNCWMLLVHSVTHTQHKYCGSHSTFNVIHWLIVQCFMSTPTQYRLYGRRFLQVKRPNQQYQSTEGKCTKEKIRQRKQQNTHMHSCIHNDRQKRIQIYSTTSPLVDTNMGWLGDGSNRGQVRQALTAVGLPPWLTNWLIEQSLTSSPTQYRLSGRQFYRSKDPTNSIKVLKGRKSYKGKPRKSKQHKIHQHYKETQI